MTTTLISHGIVPEYPKIETIFDRDPANMKRVIVGKYRLPEFEAVNRWHVTEKIDGTNIRIAILPDGTVFYGGRTDDAQVPPFLMEHLRSEYTLDRLRHGIEPSDSVVTIYGEGYGPKIQGCGGNYRKGSVAFRMFDVRVGEWWLARGDMEAIANKCGIQTAPKIGVLTTEEAMRCVDECSRVAAIEGGNADFRHEGIIARSEPLMLTRGGQRIMWKLKRKDLQ